MIGTAAYYITQGISQLLRYGVQSVLVVLGVAIGTANIIVLMSITDLGRRQTMGVINDLGANVLVVMPYLETGSGAVAHMLTTFSPVHLPARFEEAVAGADGIDKVAPVLALPAAVTTDEISQFTTVLGVNESFLELRGHRVQHGRWFTREEITGGAPVACLGRGLAALLFPEGDALGRSISIKGISLQVVGIMIEKGKVGFEDIDSIVIIPLAQGQRLFSLDGFHGLFARFTGETGPETAIRSIYNSVQSQIETGESVEEVISVLSMKDATLLMDETLAVFRLVLGGIASISLVVGGIGIMNVMLIRVLQRRLEIGLRRAAGATRRQVLVLFLIEGVLLAVAGGLLGIGIGFAGVWLYCQSADWSPYVKPLTVVWSSAFCVATGVLFSFLPALRAAGQDPVVCLRSQ